MSKIKEELEKQQFTGSLNEIGDEDYLYEEYLKNEKLIEEYWEEETKKANSIFPDDMFYDDEYYKSTYHPTKEEEEEANKLFDNLNTNENEHIN